MPDIKFCGLTRPEDAAEAGRCAAAYAGVIFAGGPRMLSAARAREVLDEATGARRVGVFAASPAATIAQTADDASLDVAQLHGDPDVAAIESLRAHFSGEVWAVLRLGSAELPIGVDRLAAVADAIVLDTRIEGRLGGTGVALDWEALAPALDEIRARTKLVLAGGLTAENAAEAIRLTRPDVVDVSSGVESAPGIKDHARMRAFAKAVRGVQMVRA